MIYFLKKFQMCKLLIINNEYKIVCFNTFLYKKCNSNCSINEYIMCSHKGGLILKSILSLFLSSKSSSNIASCSK